MKNNSFVVDTSALAPLFADENELSGENARIRGAAMKFFGALSHEGYYAFIPSPVIYELLCGATLERSLNDFLKLPNIDVVPLDRAAAAFASRCRPSVQGARQALKFDACIAGVAMALGCRRIIAFDGFFDKVDGISRVDYPDVKGQVSFLF